MARGDHEAARGHLESAIALTRNRRGTDPVAETANLANLARCRARLGDSAGARELYRQALASREIHIESNLSGMGERERLVLVEKFRQPFLESLDLVKGEAALDEEVYKHLIV